MPDARSEHARVVAGEFERTAAAFAERTKGRFDDLDVAAFSGVDRGDTVVEVGAGTGNFLALFSSFAARLVAVDLTLAMLLEARSRHPDLHLVAGDGLHLPLASGSAGLVACAQVLHHVPEPVPFLVEMRRVCGSEGRVLVVDQVATERYEEAVAMNELELLRDPSHAAARPPSALRVALQAAGLRILQERIMASEQRLSTWMWTEEFPAQRIRAVKEFIAARGAETGMRFERAGDDWVFERRRMMVLADRA